MTYTALWPALALVALAGLFFILIYNRLVRARALVREGWSGITVQLRRRADLVPNLVATVRGYAAHERDLLDAVTARRSDAVKAALPEDAARADAALGGMLGRLMAVVEAYPELKADTNFRALQTELSAIETELQSARRYYNATVRDLNTRVASFPDLLVAGPLGFREEQYFEDADPAIASAPPVRFDSVR
uniref:LemA family protein n=1 Tax=Sphingomonas populi TaxID=2484750 RepID=UPI001E2F1553|nr:LemA family protein [Sphingomonas populi]